ncbi:SDR family oxidoreductase [Scopulibacillus cellulosilyticus]|uniref:SDR family oxidoreductase n=1 Tax=Scopulibacillus cellulosilyticus TaxID=2665665 RepID=A0ABW2Q0U3_9BACL
MGRLDSKVSLITGGASGIGKAIAMLFSKEGSKIAITDINKDNGQSVVDEIKNSGGEAIFIQHDVTKEDEWKKAIDIVQKQFGKLDVLVNNAGIGLAANVEECTYEQWRKVLSINLDGVFLGTKYGVQAMKNNQSGSIINMSSIEGFVGDPNLAAYNASKGGVRILTKSAALHCAKSKYGVRVNSVHPGYIKTPMVEKDDEKSKAVVKYLESLHPVGHLGDPIDIAYGALYLASDESKFTTGSELLIDGGYTAQ